MPCIKFPVTRDGVSAEQKAGLIRGATGLVVRVLVGRRTASELRRQRGGDAS
jgi:phenylpyruvate tautomerase PptA (4-oxalocrotonate tautomerase family)